MNRAGKLIQKKTFSRWLDSLKPGYKLIGPVKDKEQTSFKEVSSGEELFLEYESTMLSPGKLFIYKPKEELFRFKLDGKISMEEIAPSGGRQIIAGVHPCDINAILYLDRTFLDEIKDPYYETRRKNTVIIALNCTHVSKNCFCASLGTGPFLNTGKGCDILLTDFGDDYLAEIKSEKAQNLFGVRGKPAGERELKLKSAKEQSVLKNFKKAIDVKGLDDLFFRNANHPIWQHTAEDRCLSCSNCVMVCPTCFCYDITDETDMDMRTITRSRRLDACQDIRFAEVHGGNFRQRRAARLRQFVTHNLNQTEQYGVTKTVGCGRCITWCPTGIDLTEMAKEIQKSKS